MRDERRVGEELTFVSTRRASGTSWRTFALAFSRAGAEMSAMRTLAPSLAKRMEVSRPMPLGGSVYGRVRRGGVAYPPAPVTMAFLPARRPVDAIANIGSGENNNKEEIG